MTNLKYDDIMNKDFKYLAPCQTTFDCEQMLLIVFWVPEIIINRDSEIN